jgi:hypothetical protein
VPLPEFFSNKKATDEGKSAIEAPALSLTKVQTTLGALITVAAAAVAKLEGPTAVKVAAIGVGALVMLGVFGLAAVDLIVRQRAEEAKLRWGAETPPAKGATATDTASTNGDAKKILVPDRNHLVLQSKHSDKEYDVLVLELEGEKATLVAHNGEHVLKPTFEPRS